MQFEKGSLYHIYNQGNNSQKIFFNRENYLFFLDKIRTYVLPYADILAWCLMPNHFHFMVFVNKIELMVEVGGTDIHGVTQSHPVNKQSSEKQIKHRTFNQSIGILLRSYTRAIHKQNGSAGALFREETKAECLNEINGIAL